MGTRARAVAGSVLTGDDVRCLRAMRGRRGPRACAERRSLLTAFAARRLSSARVLAAYHDELLFIVAHPDDADVLAIATAELQRLAEVLREAAPSTRERLAQTGIAHTNVNAAFGLDVLRWLLDAFPADVEIAYEDGSAGDGLDDLLLLLAATPEVDGLMGQARSRRSKPLPVRRYGSAPVCDSGAIPKRPASPGS